MEETETCASRWSRGMKTEMERRWIGGMVEEKRTTRRKSGNKVRVRFGLLGEKCVSLGQKGGLCAGNAIGQVMNTKDSCGQWRPGGKGNDRKDAGTTVKDGWSGRRQGYGWSVRS